MSYLTRLHCDPKVAAALSWDDQKIYERLIVSWPGGKTNFGGFRLLDSWDDFQSWVLKGTLNQATFENLKISDGRIKLFLAFRKMLGRFLRIRQSNINLKQQDPVLEADLNWHTVILF